MKINHHKHKMSQELQANLDNPYPQSEEPELDMFNHNYQRARNILGKRFYVPPTGCDACFTSIFKHLIHIFLIILLVSIVCML